METRIQQLGLRLADEHAGNEAAGYRKLLRLTIHGLTDAGAAGLCKAHVHFVRGLLYVLVPEALEKMTDDELHRFAFAMGSSVYALGVDAGISLAARTMAEEEVKAAAAVPMAQAVPEPEPFTEVPGFFAPDGWANLFVRHDKKKSSRFVVMVPLDVELRRSAMATIIDVDDKIDPSGQRFEHHLYRVRVTKPASTVKAQAKAA